MTLDTVILNNRLVYRLNCKSLWPIRFDKFILKPFSRILSSWETLVKKTTEMLLRKTEKGISLVFFIQKKFTWWEKSGRFSYPRGSQLQAVSCLFLI